MSLIHHATFLKNIRLIDVTIGFDQITNLLISSDGIFLNPSSIDASCILIDGKNKIALPGLIDMHVHFRQPGFEYKETIETGSRAALAGGVTTVVVMPNTNPALDTAERVVEQINLTNTVNGVEILVAGAVSKDLLGQEPTDYATLKKAGVVGITDDGRPVMNEDLMNKAMRACAESDLLFMQHAEDLSLSQSASMNKGKTSQMLCIKGQLADAEGAMVERDIALAKKYDARYHVLHLSTKRSLDAVRKAKMEGLKVSCEVTPHHLLLNDQACASWDTNKKMNPPLRDENDRLALIEGLIDGSVDAVASDHAPHSAKEKQNHFCQAPFGVVGLETAFAVLLTLVNQGIIPLSRAVALMTSGPAKILQKQNQIGTVSSSCASNNLCIIDLESKWQVDAQSLQGRSKNSAFLGMELHGKVIATFLKGNLRYLQDTRDKIC
jgi:dihydroorotase